jgi:hypothetical protein
MFNAYTVTARGVKAPQLNTRCAQLYSISMSSGYSDEELSTVPKG